MRKETPQASADLDRLVRDRRIRADSKRSLSVNLAEGIALSHRLHSFAGIALTR